ncbi:MAG: sulfotransferase [Phycisphaerae bacterium]|nr:sulfotransferase [Phycisphaerae bacterium]
MDLSQFIFVTGFARGGTSWLRNCIASHPDVMGIKGEHTVFNRFRDDRKAIKEYLSDLMAEQKLQGKRFVEKSPANAPFIDLACRTIPEAKFLFIIRDPRDVLISHQRGTEAWMGGVNSTIEGCMGKIRKYFEGYLRAETAENLMLVSYEQLHQDFFRTMERVYTFLGLPTNTDVLQNTFDENNFWKVASRHRERRDMPERKGVIGDWINYLDPQDRQWFEQEPWWSDFMREYGYTWETPTFEAIFDAMNQARVRYVSEEQLLDHRLEPDAVNVLVTHDIDLLDATRAGSILEAAEIEGKLGVPAIFYFLPLDDPRYAKMPPGKTIDILHQIRQLNPQAAVGLHLNAAERFFPTDRKDVDDDHPDVALAVEYLHEQVSAYERYGITFRTATAHGYGRRKALPNNRDSLIFTEELHKRNIQLWDRDLRPAIKRNASHIWFYSDIGGAVSVHDMPVSGTIDDPDTYRRCPSGSLLHCLIHPGNYPFGRSLTLGLRTNVIHRGKVGNHV